MHNDTLCFKSRQKGCIYLKSPFPVISLVFSLNYYYRKDGSKYYYLILQNICYPQRYSRVGWCVLEAAVLRCCSKQVSLKISQISQENTCAVVCELCEIFKKTPRGYFCVCAENANRKQEQKNREGVKGRLKRTKTSDINLFKRY